MKKLFLSLVAIAAVNLFSQAQNEKVVGTPKESPQITFTNQVHDFGTIQEGDVVETVFEFTNTGNAPLTIQRISASCGCTVPKDWKKEPIMPGEKSSFSVKFNSKNKPNKQNKRITILSNAPGKNFASIKANVIPDPELEKARKERIAKYKAQRAEREKMQHNQSQANKTAPNTNMRKPGTKKAVKAESNALLKPNQVEKVKKTDAEVAKEKEQLKK